MTNETLRMQMLAGVITEGQYKAKLQENAEKASLNESMIGGIVGIGAINQIPPRAKADYEMAFEHFLGERYETKFENREQDPYTMKEEEEVKEGRGIEQFKIPTSSDPNQIYVLSGGIGYFKIKNGKWVSIGLTLPDEYSKEDVVIIKPSMEEGEVEEGKEVEEPNNY